MNGTLLALLSHECRTEQTTATDNAEGWHVGGVNAAVYKQLLVRVTRALRGWCDVCEHGGRNT